MGSGAWHRLFVAPLFLVSGAALTGYILFYVPLRTGLAVLGGLAALVAVAAWYRSTPVQRQALRRRAGAGLVAGVLATAAYDLFRYIIIEVLSLTFWPFDVFTLFGELLVGDLVSGAWVTAAGVGYHVINGVGFAAAYGIVLGERGWKAGLAWAFALELAMVSLYPGWLGLKALPEFLSVSVMGHVAYGWVLGTVCQRRLQKGQVM